jgi:hypothetical protein
LTLATGCISGAEIHLENKKEVKREKVITL